MSQNTERRHDTQLQEWWKRKARENGDRRDQAEIGGLGRGRWQLPDHEILQQPREYFLSEISGQRADRGADQGQCNQFQHTDRQDETLAGTETLHQGDIVEVTVRIPPRCHGDRDSGQQHADQSGEIEKSTGAIHRRTDLRACFRDIQKPFARLACPFEIRLERRDLRAHSGKQREIRYPASRLDELRGGDVRKVHESIRGELCERGALIGSVIEDASDAQTRRPDAEAVANGRIQRGEQA